MLILERRPSLSLAGLSFGAVEAPVKEPKTAPLPVRTPQQPEPARPSAPEPSPVHEPGEGDQPTPRLPAVCPLGY